MFKLLWYRASSKTYWGRYAGCSWSKRQLAPASLGKDETCYVIGPIREQLSCLCSMRWCSKALQADCPLEPGASQISKWGCGQRQQAQQASSGHSSSAPSATNVLTQPTSGTVHTLKHSAQRACSSRCCWRWRSEGFLTVAKQRPCCKASESTGPDLCPRPPWSPLSRHRAALCCVSRREP